MLLWALAAVAALAIAALQYGWGGAPPRRAAAPAALRTGALTFLLAALLDAPLGRARAPEALVALDASASWRRGGDTLAWREARTRAGGRGGDSLVLFGDSARGTRSAPGAPSDAASRVRPAVERAVAAGRPIVVVTDGEIDDPDALRRLPAGSRVEVVPRAARPDGALAALDAPRAAVGGDTLTARVTLVAGAAGAPAGELRLAVADRQLAAAAVDALPPYGERAVELRGRVAAPEGPAILRATFVAAADAEPRNDTLAVSLDVSPAAAAVFVSSSPDFDARFALAVLRGALAVPTRGYFRVAPGQWRQEGTLAPVPEREVRGALRGAPLAVLHGDSDVFGPPRSVTQSPLVLLVPAPRGAGDWFVSGAPASPLAPALAGLPWDSLPPIDAGTPPGGAWVGLEATRGRGLDRRPVVVGSERPRRVVVAASGLWRWQFRGGRSADAFAALWGSIFDWVAADRGDARAALPSEGVIRAGEPIRWRRGAAGDTTVVVRLARRGAAASGRGGADSVTLHFPRGATVAETPPLEPGVYDVRVPGGTALLVVNPSREWLPRRPTVSAGGVGGLAAAVDAPGLRERWWAYAAALALLCAEWIVRRRVGLR